MNGTSLFVCEASLLAIVLQLFPDPNSPWSITAGVKQLPPPADNPNKLCANRIAIFTMYHRDDARSVAQKVLTFVIG